MSRGPCKFTQADITRAVRGAIAAGVEVREVVVDASGAVRIITGKSANLTTVGTPLDQWIAHHAGEA